eukprot:2795933-Amphidinium_carterae.2
MLGVTAGFYLMINNNTSGSACRPSSSSPPNLSTISFLMGADGCPTLRNRLRIRRSSLVHGEKKQGDFSTSCWWEWRFRTLCNMPHSCRTEILDQSPSPRLHARAPCTTLKLLIVTPGVDYLF